MPRRWACWRLGSAIGYLTDLIEGTPHGLRALGLGLLLLLLHRVAGQLLVGGRLAQGAVAALAMLVFRLMLTLIVLVADGDRDLAWSGLRELTNPACVLTAGVAPVAISVLSRIDARLWSKVAKPGLWA
jgi:cell shape-determining protein MreD